MLFNEATAQDTLEEEAFISDEGLLPPRHALSCLGHEEIEKKLLEDWQNNRMPHALIFAGLEGIGKSTLAFRLARFLLKHGKNDTADAGPGLFGDDLPAEKPEDMDVAADDPIFRQVASGGHPDLLVVERPESDNGNRVATLPVEVVRQINPFLQKTASQGGWRVVIVDDADLMNRSSQNAILKVLEEPPAYTILILIAHRPGALVPTIRSRCRTIDFKPLNQDDFSSLLRTEVSDIAPTESAMLYSIAGGSIGQGIRLWEEGGLDMIETISGLCQSWPRLDWAAIHSLSNSLARGKTAGLNVFAEIFLWITDCFVKARARQEPLPEALSHTALTALYNGFDLSGWIEIHDKLQEHFTLIDRANLDKKQAVLGAFALLD